MNEVNKALKSELIRLTELAHERELSKAQRDLDGQFEEWRTHKIDPFQLDDAIHLYHRNTAKELWHKYVNNSFYDLLVVQAIARDILSPSDLSAGLLEFLKPKLRQYESAFRRPKGPEETED